jgi:hypothetical protein
MDMADTMIPITHGAGEDITDIHITDGVIHITADPTGPDITTDGMPDTITDPVAIIPNPIIHTDMAISTAGIPTDIPTGPGKAPAAVSRDPLQVIQDTGAVPPLHR